MVTAAEPQFCPHCAVEITLPATGERTRGDLPPDCPHCRRPLEHAKAEERGETTRHARDDILWRYVDNPWVLLAVLFFATAGMGIPFLWKSRAFGPVVKSILTVILIIYTVFILWLFYLVMAWSWGRIVTSWEALV